jgi:hypothetical protein
VLGAIACLLSIAATRSSVGISPDSVEYLDMAARRASVSRLPPGYPVLLRVASPRAVNAVAFGVTTAALALIAGVPAAIFALTSTDLVVVHAMAWSEAAFIALMVAFLVSLSRARTTAAGLLGATLPLVRLVGVAAIPALLITTWRSHGPRRALGITVAASVPVLAFATATRGAARSLAWHPPDAVAWTSLAATVMGWFAPQSAPAAFYVIGPLIATGVIILAWRARATWPPIVRIALVWCAAYVAVVGLARTFVDALVPFDARMLAPLLVALVIAAGAATRHSRLDGATNSTIALAGIGVWVAVRGIDAAAIARRAGREGLGFASLGWTRSALASEIRRMPREAVIFSNAADGFAYATGRVVRFIPSVHDPLTRRPVSDSAAVAARFVAAVDRDHAYVVYARDVARWRPYILPESTFSRILGRAPRYVSDSGAVYR